MPPPSSAPSASGADSAPSRPSQPITCARQRMARTRREGAGRGRAEQRERRGDEVVDRAGDDERAERPGDPDRGGGERGLGAVGRSRSQTPAPSSAEREAAGEQRARALAEPAARDRDREQEREAGENGEAAEPGEDAAAEEVLEVALRRAGPRGGAARRRRRGASARRRAAARLARAGRGRDAGRPRGAGCPGAGASARHALLERVRARLERGDPVLNHRRLPLLTSGR